MEMFVATVGGGNGIGDVIVPAKVVARRGFYEERAKCEFLSFFLPSPFFFFLDF